MARVAIPAARHACWRSSPPGPGGRCGWPGPWSTWAWRLGGGRCQAGGPGRESCQPRDEAAAWALSPSPGPPCRVRRRRCCRGRPPRTPRRHAAGRPRASATAGPRAPAPRAAWLKAPPDLPSIPRASDRHDPAGRHPHGAPGGTRGVARWRAEAPGAARWWAADRAATRRAEGGERATPVRDREAAAVTGALPEAWSHRQGEGQSNKLQLLKRRRSGRAQLDVLKARFLAAA